MGLVPDHSAALGSAPYLVPLDGCTFAAMRELKELWRQYSPYFIDVWQYLVIIVIFIIAALFVL